MSAFIVEEKCLNNIINFLIMKIQKTAYYTNGQCSKLIKKRGYNLAKGL